VSQERLSMRKIKEVLRLRSLGLKQRQIADSCSISQSTVHAYLKAAEAAGKSWPAIADWDDGQLEKALFAQPAASVQRSPHWIPDFALIHRELQSHKHVTLQLVWEEYREAHPDSYGYSRFCDLYRSWLQKRDVVLRQQHRAGEKLFVDHAGDTIPLTNRETGEITPTYLFVAVLGASNYTYAEATLYRDLPNWISSHVRAFEFFSGVPEIVVPDNWKTGVTRACRYEPDLNRTYLEMAQHYHVAIIPARAGKPKDKAKVESGVLLAERWIIAALRHRTFFDLLTLNQAIAELLDRLNHRPFKKREGNRWDLFCQLDRPALQPLPPQPYCFGEWKTVRVNIDYHVEVDRHYYSVPYQLVSQEVEARCTATTIEIFHRGRRVTSHARSSVPYHATTQDEHRPKSHRAHLEWTPSRIIDWASTSGPAVGQLVETILASKPHPEAGYRSCLGLIRLGKTYSAERLEKAAARALALQAYSYHSVNSILERGLDRQPLPENPPPVSPIQHPNLRGASYFEGECPTLDPNPNLVS
jgi:transposase